MKKKNCTQGCLPWEPDEGDPHPYEFWTWEGTERIPITDREDCPGGRVLRRVGKNSGISKKVTRKEAVNNARDRRR